MSKKTLSLSSKVRYREVGGDGVLVHLENGRVIVVNEVGLHIIEQLDTARTRKALAASISTQFDVSDDQADTDLHSYLAELDAEQVLQYFT